MKKGYFIILFYCISLVVAAQDTTLVLEQERFLQMVLEYHPVARQSRLVIEQGEYGIRKARGSFDPSVFTYYDNKQFQSKEYYSMLGTGLKVPTWVGVDMKLGYDQNQGDFLNPEASIPENGLWYAGVSVPLGEGLFIDERRKVVKQARLFSQYTRAEQSRILNDLLLDAMENYWYWVKTFSQLRIFDESVGIALTRFNAVRDSYLQGDKPAVDTLEAFIQVQNRRISANQALIEYQKATLSLSNYLWYENDIPLEITDKLIPPLSDALADIEIISESELSARLTGIEDSHPELQLYQYKQADLAIEERWKKEKIKPKLNLNYNFLSETIGPTAENYGLNNYKWGLEFSLPLFLRSEIGDLRLTQIKQEEVALGRSRKTLEVINKVLVFHQQLKNLMDQIDLYALNVTNYEQLLRAERLKFDAGESSLFLINSREISLIEARIKYIEVETKVRISYVGYFWAAGSLFNEYNPENF